MPVGLDLRRLLCSEPVHPGKYRLLHAIGSVASVRCWSFVSRRLSL